MSDLVAQFREWADSFRADIEALEAVVESDAVDMRARKYAAGALNYVVSRMDLVPDWNETIGMLDDVFVLRVCAHLGNNHDLVEVLENVGALVRVGEMLGHVETIQTFLGRDLYAKLEKYCARLSEGEVRGRSAVKIVEDAATRASLYKDLHDELLRMPVAEFKKPDEALLNLKSYLHHKLSSM